MVYFVFWETSLQKVADGRILRLSVLMFCSLSGVEWEGKHKNKEIAEWEINGRLSHEQCHLSSGLRENRIKIPRLFSADICCKSLQNQFSEQNYITVAAAVSIFFQD